MVLGRPAVHDVFAGKPGMERIVHGLDQKTVNQECIATNKGIATLLVARSY